MKPTNKASDNFDNKTSCLKDFVQSLDYKKYDKNFEFATSPVLANRVFTREGLIIKDGLIDNPGKDKEYIQRLTEIGQIVVNISELLIYLETENNQVEFFKEFDKTDNHVNFLEDLARELDILKGQKAIPINVYEIEDGIEVLGTVTHYTRWVKENGLIPVTGFFPRVKEGSKQSKNGESTGGESSDIGHVNSDIGITGDRAQIPKTRNEMLQRLKQHPAEPESEAGEDRDTAETDIPENPDSQESASTIEIQNLLGLSEARIFFTDLLNKVERWKKNRELYLDLDQKVESADLDNYVNDSLLEINTNNDLLVDLVKKVIDLLGQCDEKLSKVPNFEQKVITQS